MDMETETETETEMATEIPSEGHSVHIHGARLCRQGRRCFADPDGGTRHGIEGGRGQGWGVARGDAVAGTMFS